MQQTEAAEQIDERDGHNELQEEFLPRGQAEVLLVLELFKVVQKADGAVDQGEDQHKDVAEISLGHQLPADRQTDDDGGENEHQTAHRRRAGFALMPCGADFLDGLPRLDLPQERDEPRAEADGNEKRDGKGRNQLYRHGCFLLSSICATISRSSMWCFTWLIS